MHASCQPIIWHVAVAVAEQLSHTTHTHTLPTHAFFRFFMRCLSYFNVAERFARLVGLHKRCRTRSSEASLVRLLSQGTAAADRTARTINKVKHDAFIANPWCLKNLPNQNQKSTWVVCMKCCDPALPASNHHHPRTQVAPPLTWTI